MTTSLTSGLPRRETWTYVPLVDFFCVVDQIADDRVLLGVALLGDPPLGHLERDRLDVETGERVVAGLGEVTAVEQVEDAQVEEERVLGLADEGLDVLRRGSSSPG